MRPGVERDRLNAGSAWSARQVSSPSAPWAGARCSDPANRRPYARAALAVVRHSPLERTTPSTRVTWGTSPWSSLWVSGASQGCTSWLPRCRGGQGRSALVRSCTTRHRPGGTRPRCAPAAPYRRSELRQRAGLYEVGHERAPLRRQDRLVLGARRRMQQVVRFGVVDAALPEVHEEAPPTGCPRWHRLSTRAASASGRTARRCRRARSGRNPEKRLDTKRSWCGAAVTERRPRSGAAITNVFAGH